MVARLFKIESELLYVVPCLWRKRRRESIGFHGIRPFQGW